MSGAVENTDWQDSGERLAIVKASVDGRREVGDAWQPEKGLPKKKKESKTWITYSSPQGRGSHQVSPVQVTLSFSQERSSRTSNLLRKKSKLELFQIIISNPTVVQLANAYHRHQSPFSATHGPHEDIESDNIPKYLEAMVTDMGLGTTSGSCLAFRLQDQGHKTCHGIYFKKENVKDHHCIEETALYPSAYYRLVHS